jgi:hypothetical protein
MLMASGFPYSGDCAGAIPNDLETGPVERYGLATELSERIEFRMLKGNAPIFTAGKMVIKLCHQISRVSVGGRPEACNHRLGSGKQKSPHQILNALLTFQASDPGVTSRQDHHLRANTRTLGCAKRLHRSRLMRKLVSCSGC